MSAVLSVHSGHSVAYMTREVGRGREGYYTGAVAAGEPPGQWYGAGAELLGLQGEVDADLMEAVYSHLQDPRSADGSPLAAAHRNYKSADDHFAEMLARSPGATPEQRAKLRAEAERKARSAVAFVDATFSPAKSVTVLSVAFERMENDARRAGDAERAAAWGAYREAVEAAVMAGARASIDYLQASAGYARVGNHAGKSGRWTDAHRWVVAQFLQHDSRDRDPQLHVHQAILNLQQDADGKWWRLDTQAIRQQHHAAGAIGARVMEAELARSIGVRFESHPDGHREVVGVPAEVMEMFSSRRRAITPRVSEYVRAFREQFGREPNRLELSQMAQRATLETRARKAHDGETTEQRLARWERQTREILAGGLGEVARSVFEASPDRAGDAARWSVEDVVERALASVSEKREKWLRSDLIRAVSECLPANLGVGAGEVRELLEALADRALEQAIRLTPDDVGESALPAELRLASGDTAMRRPGQVYYTTDDQVAGERALRAAAVERGAVALPAVTVRGVLDRYAENGVELGADQAAAVRGVLTDSARVSVLHAPAGTGKSFTVGVIAGAWHGAGYQVHGLAPSQVAAEVLADEGLPAWNTAAWLGAMRRGVRTDGGPPALQAGDLVVVDEAGMTSTDDLASVVDLARAADAKVLLVGDDKQLAAVGPGGAFADLAERSTRYELAEVRRFRAEWEREASLRLRAGDVDVLDEYDRRGRLVDGGTPEQAADKAARRWLADTVEGRESLLIVPTNEQAAQVSAQLRSELIRLGRVSPYAATHLGRDGNYASIGDIVQARHNAWDLRNWSDNTRAPINRETYRVVLSGYSALTVEHTRTGDRLDLPPEYVRDHLTLAYASTVHAAQGRTVDTAHLVAGQGTDAAGLYVGATRGREANTIYAITVATTADEAAGAAQDVERRAPRAVLADIVERERDDRSALGLGEDLAADARSTATLLERLTVAGSMAAAGRAAQLLDMAAATGAITDEQRVAFAADPAMGTLERLLRQVEVAGHDPAAVLSGALHGELDTAVRPASVVHHRIRQTVDLTLQLESAHQLIPRDVDAAWRPHLEHLAAAADARRVELGQQTAADAPDWAVEALGPVPDDPIARAEWEHRAGWAAAHRELVGHDDAADALGDPPPALLLEKRAMWATAHAALGLPDRGPDERAASDGQLRARVVAAERARAWAPRWVGDALAAAAEKLEDVRASASLLMARARAGGGEDGDVDPELAAAAEEAAREADKLEQTVAQLRMADDVRTRWALHEAVTIDEGERADVELEARGVDRAAERKVTAAEWLAEHRAAMAAEDPHRHVTDGDVDELPHDAGEVLDEILDETLEDAAAEVVETAVPDVRDLVEADRYEYADPDGGTRQVPSDDELAEIVERAQITAAELAARAPVDAAHTDDVEVSGPALQQWADEDVAVDVDETAGV